MKRIIVSVLTLPVFLVGCAEDNTVEPKPDAPRAAVEKGENFTKLRLAYNYRDAYLFDMDGTRCIMATNEGAVALSCDWTGK